MKSVEHLPPTRWAALAALGSLLMVTPALFALLKLPVFLAFWGTPGAAWPLRLLRLGPFLVGFCMAIVAVTRLRRGVKINVWSEPELETLRRWTRNPVWVAVSIASFLLGIGIVVADHGSRYGGLFCFLAAPAQILMNLANTAKPVVNVPEHIDLNGSAAMRSEHWGDPPSGTVG
jgi:hypothetical protein